MNNNTIDAHDKLITLMDKILQNQGIQTEKINHLTTTLERYDVQEIKNQLLITQNEMWGSDPHKTGGMKEQITKLKADKKMLYTKIDDLIASENRRAGMIIAINFAIVCLGAIATIMTILKNT